MKNKSIKIKVKNGDEYIVQLYNNRSDIMLTTNGITEIVFASSNMYKTIAQLLKSSEPTVDGSPIVIEDNDNIFVAATRTHYKNLLGESYSPNKTIAELCMQVQAKEAVARLQETLAVEQKPEPIEARLSNKFTGGKNG